jgi:hypothetical protein
MSGFQVSDISLKSLSYNNVARLLLLNVQSTYEIIDHSE